MFYVNIKEELLFFWFEKKHGCQPNGFKLFPGDFVPNPCYPIYSCMGSLAIIAETIEY